jgi:hypothetical protein
MVSFSGSEGRLNSEGNDMACTEVDTNSTAKRLDECILNDIRIDTTLE